MKTLKQMKQKISLALAAVAAMCISITASAHHGDPDKFRSEKIAFITTELNLTPAEAEKFWPVYNQAAEEKKVALETVIKAYKDLGKAVNDKASEAEISKLTKAYLDANSAFQTIDNKYLKDFQSVLPAEKVAKLYLSEEKFRRQQIHRLGKNKDKEKDKDRGAMFGERGPRNQKDRP